MEQSSSAAACRFDTKALPASPGGNSLPVCRGGGVARLNSFLRQSEIMASSSEILSDVTTRVCIRNCLFRAKVVGAVSRYTVKTVSRFSRSYFPHLGKQFVV